MWIRYHIKCHNCTKTTNLRLQLISREKQEIKFNCPNLSCNSIIEGTLYIDYKKFSNYKPGFKEKILSIFKKSSPFNGFMKNFHESLHLKMVRGESIADGFNAGDYFLEYSDGIPVSSASTVVHDKWTPYLRQASTKKQEMSFIDSTRNLHQEELWSDFNDLLISYQSRNNSNIEIIGNRILKNSYLNPTKEFDYSSEIGRVTAYYTVLNYFIFPWIDFEKHTNYIDFIFNTMFKNGGLENVEFESLSLVFTSDPFLLKFNRECTELVGRFVQLRSSFKSTYQNIEFEESNISNPDFNTIKNFYTDCFEFVGRYSVIPFKLMNIIERGSMESLPTGIPRNILNTEDFKNIDHGKRMDILSRCTTPLILEIFENRFDSKLRNGINHYKTNFNVNDQIISYFPVTQNPNQEFRIAYDDFLLKSLNIFESVLRINQLIKMFHYYNRDIAAIGEAAK
jgi:hypothetical protein